MTEDIKNLTKILNDWELQGIELDTNHLNLINELNLKLVSFNNNLNVEEQESENNSNEMINYYENEKQETLKRLDKQNEIRQK